MPRRAYSAAKSAHFSAFIASTRPVARMSSSIIISWAPVSPHQGERDGLCILLLSAGP